MNVQIVLYLHSLVTFCRTQWNIVHRPLVTI